MKLVPSFLSATFEAQRPFSVYTLARHGDPGERPSLAGSAQAGTAKG